LAAKDVDNKSQLSNITSLSIGKDYAGEIGEIVIFTRSLKGSERLDIENYITTKWKAPNTRNSSVSCLQGTVTVAGCVASCKVSIEGESTTSLEDGESEDFDCDQDGYSGGVNYTCGSGGSLSTTGSGSAITCIASSGTGYGA